MHASAPPFANVVRLLKPTLHSEQKQILPRRKRHRACRCSLKHYPSPTQNRLFATSQLLISFHSPHVTSHFPISKLDTVCPAKADSCGSVPAATVSIFGDRGKTLAPEILHVSTPEFEITIVFPLYFSVSVDGHITVTSCKAFVAIVPLEFSLTPIG